MVEPLGNFTKIVPIEQIEVNKCIKGHTWSYAPKSKIHAECECLNVPDWVRLEMMWEDESEMLSFTVEFTRDEWFVLEDCKCEKVIIVIPR